jgi:superfamily II DNA/RNA helicase
MSKQSFTDLGVSSAVSGALSKRGIVEPFAVQRLVIGDVLAGRDALVRSPTGSGKTLAFGVPMVERIEATAPRPAALVLAPTRELATQIVEEIRDVAHARALRVSAVYGGVGIAKQAREAATSHILVATPGRLEDLLQRRAFTLEHTRILVLDEADRMLDMGFLPAVKRIVSACPAERQTLFFSATLDGEAGSAGASFTRDPVRREHHASEQHAAPAIEHRFVPVPAQARERVGALVAELACDRDLAIVFVRTKRGADRLVKDLGGHGVEAVAMHGNKSQRQRERALARFESGAVDTLVATDVAARGIDVAGVSHVINFDPPEDRDAYIHRIGRTGRAGRRGTGITLVRPDDHHEAGRLARQLGIKHDLPQTGGSGPNGGGNKRRPTTAGPRQPHPRHTPKGRGPSRRRRSPA